MNTANTWVLTDVDQGVWLDTLELDHRTAGLPEGAFIRKRTRHGGLTDGVDVVEVHNGAFSFTVLPTRGMGLWRGNYRGLHVGWQPPVRGPVHPKFVHPAERGGLGWLAGFDECIVRCGLESNGAPCDDVIPSNTGAPTTVRLTLHGRIANIPAHYVAMEIVPGPQPELVVTGVVDEAMLFCPQFRLTTRISTRLGSNAVTLSDRITNLAATPQELELLYHCNFGNPFLEPGARLVLAAAQTAARDAEALADLDRWATYAGPTAGYIEKCYWHEPLGDAAGQSVAMLRNAAGTQGAALRFNTRELPCFTQWKNCGAMSDGYVTGLEPGTNYPNPRTFERAQGRVIRLEPGQEHTATVTLEIHDTAAGVQGIEAEIAALQANRPHRVHPAPRKEWSPE